MDCILKTLEFQFWERYSHVDSDDEINIKRSAEEMRSNVFTMNNNASVICSYCGMIVKTRFYKAHNVRRHGFGPMSDVALMINELQCSEGEENNEEGFVVPSAKRLKTDNEMSHGKQIIECQSDYLQSQESFEKDLLAQTSFTLKRQSTMNNENVLSPSGFMRPRPVSKPRQVLKPPIASKNMKTMEKQAETQNQNSVATYQSQTQQKCNIRQADEALQLNGYPKPQVKSENPLRLKMKFKKSSTVGWQVVKA